MTSYASEASDWLIFLKIVIVSLVQPAFGPKLRHGTLKGLGQALYELSCILSTGQGQGQVTEGHQRPTFPKRHMIHGLWVVLHVD